MKFDDTLEAFEAMLVVVVYAFEMQPTFCLILQYFATKNLLALFLLASVEMSLFTKKPPSPSFASFDAANQKCRNAW